MKKRILATLLATVLAMSLLPVPYASATYKTVKRYYQFEDDSISFEAPGKGKLVLKVVTPVDTRYQYVAQLIGPSGKDLLAPNAKNMYQWYTMWLKPNKEVTVFSGTVEKGTYYFKTYYLYWFSAPMYDRKSNLMKQDFTRSKCNGSYYTLTWDFTCQHSNWERRTEIPPSCTREGLEVKVCKDCREGFDSKKILKLDHKGEWVVTTEPTCEESGVETLSCSSCKKDYTRSVSALGHDYSEWERVTEPNCEEEGHEARTCERCGKVDIRILKAKGHSFGGWRTVEEPACGVKGTQERVCSRCDKKETQEVAALRHSFGAWTVSVPATCQQEGTEVRSCVHGCGEEETRAVPVLKTHTYGEWEVTQKGNCTTKGTKQRVCTVCGQVDQAQTDMEDDHDMGEWTVKKAATCGEEGTEARICARCGKEETRAIPTLEHTYGEWTVTQKGSCAAKGEKQRKCTVCGQLEKQATELEDDHSFGPWRETKQPTCEEQGEEVHTCRICQMEETREVPVLMHDYGVWQVTVKATCAQEGSQQHFCKNCNEREIEIIPKLPHSNEEIDLGLIGDRHGYRSRCKVCGYESKAYFKGENSDQEISATKVDKANANAPVVIVLVVPAFGDVSASSWYQNVVTYAYNLGLMVGTSETTFNPLGNVTVGEAVTMAARARNSYEGGSNEDFTASNVWYQTYVDYALKKNIIKDGDFDDYTRVATRAEMAYIFAHALPDSGMKAINRVKTLPDVDSSTKYSSEIFKLYNAGVITGSDSQGTFLPNRPITRSEAAAIITRVTLSSERKTLELK